MMETRLQYPSLNTSTEFRVLKLECNDNEDFHASLLAIDLETQPHIEYKALSYCWGDATSVSTIYIHNLNTVLELGRNLTDALQRLRRDRLESPIFIDAICINQSDVQERNQQVKLMTRIYSSATEVVAWLGSDDGSSRHVIDLLQKWAQVCEDSNVDALSQDIIQQDVQYVSRPSATSSITGLAPPMTKEEFRIIRYFFNRQWFSRAWIVQEAGVAQKVTVVCGDTVSIDFATIGTASTQLDQWLRGSYSQINDRWHSETFAHKARHLWRTSRLAHGGVSLSDFNLFHSFQSTEHHDRIFAFCGIMSIPEEFRQHFEVDYNRDIKDVYTQACLGIIKATKDLEIISLAPLQRDQNHSLPSWVPNFHSTDSGHLARKMGRSQDCRNTSLNTSTKHILNASAGLSANIKDTDSAGELCVEGIRFRAISEARDINGAACMNEADMRKLKNNLALQFCTFRDYWLIWPRGFSTAFAEATTHRYSKKKHHLDEKFTTTEQVFADFRAFLSKWTEAISALEETDKQSRVCKALAEEIDALLNTWQEEDLRDGVLLEGQAERYLWSMQNACTLSKICSVGRYVGVGATFAQEGDMVVVLFGASEPCVLRQIQRDDRICWQFKGTIWLPGLMDGEIFRFKSKKSEFFTLV